MSKHAQRSGVSKKRPTLNVGLSLSLVSVLRGLERATGRYGYADRYIRGNDVVPGGFDLPGTPDPAGFAVDYMWSSLLSKFDDGNTSAAKDSVAFAKFADAEMQCGITNLRLSRMEGLPEDLATSDPERLLFVARRKIRGLLGKFSWDHAARGMGFSSGASTRLPRRRGTPPYKYSGKPETTYANAGLAHASISTCPAWKSSLISEEGTIDFTFVEGNRLQTVAKNYKTNRVIAIEPDMNMYVQRGLGSLIRERLLRHARIDLREQGVNQKLAFLGSVTGSVATVDLSAASDSVSSELVRFLCPREWVEAFEYCRSPVGILPSGEKVYYRKISSMGNGFTFELETLIFWAIALACTEFCGGDARLVSVYGDDIILPYEAAPLLREVLDFAGFTFNEDKSFIVGPFRESCGKHYHSGIDVTPIYIRNNVHDLVELFKLHNSLWRWFNTQRANPEINWDEVGSLLRSIRNKAPCNWRKPRIPDGFGDGAFIGTFEEATPRLACTLNRTAQLKKRAGPIQYGKRDGWEGYIVEVLASVTAVADLRGVYSEDDPYVPSASVWSEPGKGKRPILDPPDEVGRLLQSLTGVGRAFSTLQSTPFEGGVPLPPRLRCINIIVDGFAPALV